MKIFCTGGAGFICSHVVDALIDKGHAVTVYDDLRTGHEEFINPKASFINGHLGESLTLDRALKGTDAVFHFAANADVRNGPKNTSIDLDNNTLGTWNVLEACRKCSIKYFVFASSAAVYGEPDIYPTPETYAGTQTSLYGASKLACEAMVQAYSNYSCMRHLIFRFVSWIGERYSHGVIFDFVKKLKANPNKLEILGNGNQQKSYLYVRDGVSAIMKAFEAKLTGTYNLGHYKIVSVEHVANVVSSTMGLNPELVFGKEPRGWLGDSPLVHLDCIKIRKIIGWIPETGINEGITRTVKYLMANPHLLERK